MFLSECFEKALLNGEPSTFLSGPLTNFVFEVTSFYSLV